MKITIPTKQLHGALTTLKPIAGLKSTLPILGNVLLEARDQSVTVSATNTDQRLSITLSCNVHKPGAVTLPANRLMLLLGVYNASETTIEVGEHSIAKLNSGSAFHKIHGLPADEFPDDISSEVLSSVKIDGRELKRLLSICQTHASIDNTKAILKSITFRARDGKLSLESGDGRRICIAATDVDLPIKDAYVMPIEAVSAMCGFDMECDLQFCNGVIRVQSPTVNFSTKCIDCQPIDFLRHVDGAKSQVAFQATFNREALAGAVNRASVTTNELSPGVKLTCVNSNLAVEGRAKDVGEGGDTLNAKDDCPDFEMGVNPLFMISALKASSEEYVTIQLKDGITPFVIQESNITIVISPIRIQ